MLKTHKNLYLLFLWKNTQFLKSQNESWLISLVYQQFQFLLINKYLKYLQE